MTSDLSTDLVARLRAAGCVFAEDEARLLLEAAATPLELATMAARRAAGVPLEHVLGWAAFLGLRIAVDPDVFVPRRRTEFLARQAIRLARPGAVVVDLCCGSGAVAAAIAVAVPEVDLSAADIEPAAVRCARRNVHGAVYEGDLYSALPTRLQARVDVLVANVPYVPSGEVALLPPEARVFEPLVALDGGADGLDVLRRVVEGAAEWLAPGGHLLFEMSTRQVPAAVELLSAVDLTPEVATDDNLAATVIIGRCAG
jgi:release factor glutamine methyltransferase